MQISNNDLKSTLNTSQSLNLQKQEKVNKKEDIQSLESNYQELNFNNTSNLTKGKTALKLEELNKQKVTPDLLQEVVTELKKDDSLKESKGKGEISEVSNSSKKNSSKIFDPRDKNRDGKVSQSEKLEAEQKKEQKTQGLIKNIISELQKDEDFINIKPEHFKGISKMVNTDIINDKDSEKINKFLN